MLIATIIISFFQPMLEKQEQAEHTEHKET